MTSESAASASQDIPVWAAVLVGTMATAPVLVALGGATGWGAMAQSVVFAVTWLGILLALGAALVRWSPVESVLETPWYVNVPLVLVTGAAAALVAHVTATSLGPAHQGLWESAWEGAGFALVWYGMGYWSRKRMKRRREQDAHRS